MATGIEIIEREITIEDVGRFLQRHGKRGEQTMSVLRKQADFAGAIDHPVGKILFDDIMKRMDRLLEKIVTEKEKDPNDISLYEALKEIVLDWSKRIVLYENAKLKIKEK